MNHCWFDFYGVLVQISSPESDLLQRVKQDFSHFYTQAPHPAPHYKFYVQKSKPPWEKIPSLPTIFQSLNSLTYEDEQKRFNDYYGKALTIYDYSKDCAEIYSLSLEKLHELTYLIVLSRVGKKMDMMGLHKLHAFGVVKNGTALLGIMPMKGGKSTHFLQLIKDEKMGIISDDTPLISRWGKVLPFPLRIGVEEGAEHALRGTIYSLQREFYGKKTLISLEGLPNPIGGKCDQIILFKGIRHRGSECVIKPTAKLFFLSALIKGQVIGLGLPMILEYFWEQGFRDFCRKSYIAGSRFLSSLLLLWRSQTYTVFLGNDPRENARVLKERFLEGF